MKRRILAMLLISVMVFSFAVTANAADTDYWNGLTFWEPTENQNANKPADFAVARWMYNWTWSETFLGSAGLMKVDVGNEQLFTGLYLDPAGEYHYFDANGLWETSVWKKIDGDWYYFKADGTIARNTYVGEYYVGDDGAYIANPQVYGWTYATKGKRGWKYIKPDGNYATGWYKVKNLVAGTYTAFNFDGSEDVRNIAVGDSNYYYFNSQGYLVQNQWVDGKYFVSKEGVMLTNSWIPNPAGYPYYVDQNGAWVPGYQGQGESQDWLQRGIATAEDRYYVLINGVRQYVKNAWQQIDGKWYYYNAQGYKVKSQWFGEYYLQDDGSLFVATSDNAAYYTYHDVTGTVKGPVAVSPDGKYFVDKNGKSLKNTWLWDPAKENYRYIGSNYKPASNTWVDGEYYVGADGYMIRDSWIGEYFVGHDGKWVR